MTAYARLLQKHLGAYKSQRLGVDAPGSFLHKGETLPYAHVLPAELKWLNILETYRTEIRRYVEARPELRLHKFFHHLNSSQAFALNLFYPFFEDGSPSVLIDALRCDGEVESWALEHVDDMVEGTNVDVSWRSTQGVRTFCEVKLSEADFGMAADDPTHRRKLDEIYRPVLSGRLAEQLLEPQTFFANYQILRNVWLVARDRSSVLVFLMPRANHGLWKPVQGVLELLDPEVVGRIRLVAMEDVLETLGARIGLPYRHAFHVQALIEKYLVRF